MNIRKTSRITAVPAAQMDWLSDLPAQGLNAAQTLQWLNLWTGQGLLRHIDSALAAQLLRLDASASPALLVATAMLAQMEGRGHTCLPLADLCQSPVALLGWLAWALSVDEWDAGWSEAIKRDAVRMAPLLHKRKGTVWALQNALTQFGMGTQVKEWWAMSPPGAPGTFALVTELTPDNIQNLGQALTQKMNAQI